MSNEKQKTVDVFHPSFFQCFPVLFVPVPLFLLIIVGVRLYYILLVVWALETSFLVFIWAFISTTFYIVMPDRIEIKTGIFVKRTRSVPLKQIVSITCKQNMFQRFFKIGDISINVPSGEPFGLVLTGVENPEKAAEYLFALRQRAR
jgi:uncharacterized membrane protein YdbT with pleckstrin-like domain